MAVNIDNKLESVGSQKEWLRASASVPVPPGWLILDGSVVADAASTFNGKTLPDKRAKFARGHSTVTNANFGSNVTYFAGGTIPNGGTDTNPLSHNHAYGFNINHQHNTPNHSHSISADGAHAHTAPNGGSPNVNNGSPLGQISTDGSHSHTGATGSANGGATGLMLSNDQQNGSVNNSLSTVDNRPVFLEFVWIIKIK